MASKVIVVGSVNGQLQSIFSKLSKLQSKTPFSFAIVAGDLFADPSSSKAEDDMQLDSLISGTISVPLPVYFTVGRYPLPPRILERLQSNEDEVCSNLTYLGKRSTIKTSEGLRIVTLGGILDPNVIASAAASLSLETTDKQLEKYSPFHSEADARALHGAHSADILLTTAWPENVTAASKVELAGPTPRSESCIAALCATLKPRYHFSTSNETFFEREPFYFPPPDNNPEARPFTRFISLASTSSKPKSLYAFNIEPAAAPPLALPAGATPSPFTNSTLGKRPSPKQDSSYARFSNDLQGYHDTEGHGNKRRKRGKHNEPRRPTQAECFFCLSNPTLATHLIAAIGNESYLTTSKGPVPTPTTYSPSLTFPAHILIIPLAHAPTIPSIMPPDGGTEEVESAYAEMLKYRRALNAMLLKKSHGKYGSVCWEISRANGVHVHWQWMPIAAEMISKGLVEAGFKVEAENASYEGKFEQRDIGDGKSHSGDWFRIWLWRPKGDSKDAPLDADKSDGNASAAAGNGDSEDADGVEKSLILPLSPVQRFDLQFGRRVMAKLLGTPERAHWRDCPQTTEEETKDVEAFKAAFKEWDFSA